MTSRSLAVLSLALCSLILVLAAAADPLPRLGTGPDLVRHGEATSLVRAEVDTFYLLGGPGRTDGRFEQNDSSPDWRGWTHEDLNDVGGVYWQVSDFQAPAGQYAMWCGTVFPGDDPGYGNLWYQNLSFTHTVADNSVGSIVSWTADLRVDTEPIYDSVSLQVNRGGAWETLQAYDGPQDVAVLENLAMDPGDYVGDQLDEIQLRVRVVTDHVYSDEDQLWDTDGACQLDDVRVMVDGVTVDFEDFEDQISDRWVAGSDGAVGDFASVWTALQDEDPCHSNYSPQVAFIDDGIVVPGTGGTMCITWCYGPGGYIVNNTGGLAGPDHDLDNRIISPVMEWPAGADAAYLQFSVFRHEDLSYNSPGIFYFWEVRSVNTGDPADLAGAPWRFRAIGGYGGPGYLLERAAVTDLLVSGPTHVQMALRVVEWGQYWGWNGTDGTPAPYFDNVQFVAYAAPGPAISARALDLLNDGFSASGALDLDDLASNAVRLDMAQNISPPAHLRNDPGDSVVFDAATIRAGAVIADAPRVHVRMKANPLFRGVRTLPPNFTLDADALQWADLVTGWVDCDSVFAPGHLYVEDRWQFDLPDSGFFYPGDILHWYIEAQDDQLGDIGTARLPADTTGFADFWPSRRYDELFSVRALPTLFLEWTVEVPPILLWEDHGSADLHGVWRETLDMTQRREGEDYDLFATNSPGSGAGNGLGGRATAEVLAGYDIIVYTAGDLRSFLLGNGDHAVDPSDDLGVLSDWFALGGKKLLLSGDNVAAALDEAGAAGQQFLDQYVGVDLVGENLRPYIGDQTAPLVRPESGNGVFSYLDGWIVYGGCPGLNRFDAVVAASGTARLAEFADPAGNDGVYPYAAATHHHVAADDADVVLLPHDLVFLYADPGSFPPPGYSARATVLDEILQFFGDYPPPPPGVAPDALLQVSYYPNPFNPRTTIALDLPRASEISLRIYDLRGAVVRTLVDERLAAGHHEIVWDGTDGRGAAVASGVYFSEVKAAGQVRVHKLALVK